MRNTKNRGFTLIEVVVAMAVFAIFMIGILNLLDTSTRVSKIETALSDTQENVRFAAYHIMRTARMMGGAGLPFAVDIGGTDTWISGQLDSNQSGTYATPFGNVDVLAGSQFSIIVNHLGAGMGVSCRLAAFTGPRSNGRQLRALGGLNRPGVMRSPETVSDQAET